MSTQTAEPATWTSRVGAVLFTLNAPHTWAVAQRRYLAEYLTDGVASPNLAAFNLTISLSAGPVGYAVADSRGAVRHVEYVPGTVLRETTTEAGKRIYASEDGDLRGAFAVTVRDRDIKLHIDNTGSNPHAFPLRLMREAMLRTYENFDGLVFHGAGIRIGERGVMVCGPRSAGKTTTLAAFLTAPGAMMLSNDRLVLDHRERLVAVPLPVPVARGTVDAVPALNGAAASLMRPQPRLRRLPLGFGVERKAEFTAREFATAFASRLVPDSPISAVVVPRFTDSATATTVRPLTEAEIGAVLMENCFTPHDEFWRSPWLVPRRRADGDLQARACERIGHLARELRGYEIAHGVRRGHSDLTAAVTEIAGSFI